MAATITRTEVPADVMQDMTGPMRFLFAAMVHGETIADLLGLAAEYAREGEPQIAADINRAADYRVRIFADYGV